MRAGEAIPAIIRTLAGLPDRQVSNVFHAVATIKRTAAGESVDQIRQQLDDLDRNRRDRERTASRRHWLAFWPFQKGV